MVCHVYSILLTRNTVAESKNEDTSITLDSDSGEILESESSTDDNKSEAADSDEEPDANDEPQMDIPDIPSHVEEQSVPSASLLNPDVCKSGNKKRINGEKILPNC